MDGTYKRRRRPRSSRFVYPLLYLLLLSIAIAIIAAARDRGALTLLVAPTDTPSVVPTATVTPTPSVTTTATPSPTATATATLIPTITPTPTPAGRFVGSPIWAAPDCSRTAVQGVVHDGNATLDGVRVRLWWPEAPPDQIFSMPSGSHPALGPGGYEIFLDGRPRAGWWLVAAVGEAGELLGEAVVIQTTDTGCEDGSGRQVIRIDFRREAGSLGIPGPTLTPAPTVIPTITPTPLPTPDGAARVLKVPILMYHYISVPPPGSGPIRRDLSVGPDIFRAHLITLREQGYTSITLTQLFYALVQGAPLPEKPVVLTFDDGYRDNYENAFQIMKEEGFVGTFFVITDLVDERNVNYMTWEQLLEMKGAGMEIGSHTRSHPSLPGLRWERVWRELVDSRLLLEQRLGQEVHVFAYPGGAFDSGVIHLAHEAGYYVAVTTKQGVTHTTGNLLTLRRVRVRGGMFPPTLMEKIHYWMYEAKSEP